MWALMKNMRVLCTTIWGLVRRKRRMRGIPDPATPVGLCEVLPLELRFPSPETSSSVSPVGCSVLKSLEFGG